MKSRHEPEMPEAVIVMVHIPPSFRGLGIKEVRRKLSNPANVDLMLDHIAQSIVQYFNKPVDYKDLVTKLSAFIPPNQRD